jgi:RNA-binding protein YhbY
MAKSIEIEIQSQLKHKYLIKVNVLMTGVFEFLGDKGVEPKDGGIL